MRRSVPVTALALSGAVFAGITARLWSFAVDDAFISLRYAKHLAEGQGLVYNIGERVEGYTNLLWTVLLAFAHVLPGDPLTWTKLFSMLSVLVAAAGIIRLASRSGLMPAEWAWLPAALWLLLPVTALSAAEGLETMQFAAILVWCLVAVFRSDGIATGLLLGALCLTRPDGAIAVPVIAGWLIARQQRRCALVAIAVLAPTLIGVELWRMTYYGDWLPNTFYAKQGGSWWLFGQGLRSMLSFLAVAGAGTWVLMARVIRRPAAVLLALVIATRIAFHLWSGGPWMGEHRFLIPAVPLILILVCSGLLELTKRPLFVAACGAMIVLPGLYLLPGRLHAMNLYAAGARSSYVALGRILNDTLPPAATIAIGDAGMLPYYADRTSIDILGLNDRHIARQPGRFMSGKRDSAYVLAKRPQVIVLLSASEGAGWRTPADADLATHPEFISAYERMSTWQLLPHYYLVAFRLKS